MEKCLPGKRVTLVSLALPGSFCGYRAVDVHCIALCLMVNWQGIVPNVTNYKLL